MKNKKVILIFLLPALVFYILFILYPVFRTFYNSFFKIGAFRIKYVGLKNFREIVKDEIFWKSAKNTLIWAGASIVLEIGTAFLLALALFNKIWLHRFFRVAWFVPVLIPYITTIGESLIQFFEQLGLETLLSPGLGILKRLFPL